MRKQRFIEVKEAPLDDPANLVYRHLDSRIRTFSHCMEMALLGVWQVALGLYNSLGPGWGTKIDSEPEK